MDKWYMYIHYYSDGHSAAQCRSGTERTLRYNAGRVSHDGGHNPYRYMVSTGRQSRYSGHHYSDFPYDHHYDF